MVAGLIRTAVFVLVVRVLFAQDPPRATLTIQPECTPQAPKGKVLLSIIVDKDGIPKNIRVVKPIGFGLDEKAVQTVSRWRFKPGTRAGVPIAVPADIEITFRLCSPKDEAPDLSRAQQGNLLFDLAIHQLRGDDGQARDPKAAFENMQKAAALDYAPAQTRLGIFYLAGVGTPTDPAKAAGMFDHAASNGDAAAEYHLGTLYRTGKGVPLDLTKALGLFQRSAEKDNPRGEFALGRAYENGEATEADPQTALKWYRKSAEQADPDAQERLAQIFWNGSGQKQNPVEALTWALLAQKNEQKDAPADIARFKAAMAPQQIAEAEKRADKFKPREPKPKK